MGKQVSLRNIERVIEELTPQEQSKLVERLAHRLRKTGLVIKKEVEWNDLYGLGKGLWNEDAQDYVDRSREDRP